MDIRVWSLRVSVLLVLIVGLCCKEPPSISEHVEIHDGPSSVATGSSLRRRKLVVPRRLAIACSGGNIEEVCDSSATLCDAVFQLKGNTCNNFCKEIDAECVAGVDQDTCGSDTFQGGCTVKSNDNNGGTVWGNSMRCRCRRTCGIGAWSDRLCFAVLWVSILSPKHMRIQSHRERIY